MFGSSPQPWRLGDLTHWAIQIGDFQETEASEELTKQLISCKGNVEDWNPLCCHIAHVMGVCISRILLLKWVMTSNICESIAIASGVSPCYWFWLTINHHQPTTTHCWSLWRYCWSASHVPRDDHVNDGTDGTPPQPTNDNGSIHQWLCHLIWTGSLLVLSAPGKLLCVQTVELKLLHGHISMCYSCGSMPLCSNGCFQRCLCMSVFLSLSLFLYPSKSQE